MEDKDTFDVKISSQTQDKFVGHRNGLEYPNFPKGHGLAISIGI